MIADIPTALCLESNNMKHTTPGNTIGTMRKGLDIYDFLSKLEEYETYFWTAETKADVETKLKEFKLIVLTTDDYVIQKAIKTLQVNSVFGYTTNWYSKLLILMIMFHISSTSARAKPPVIKIDLSSIKVERSLYDNPTVSLDDVAEKYLDVFYQGLTPSESIHTIHDVWKSCPEIELVLQMTYCRRLLRRKEYKKLKDLVSNEMELFVSCLFVKSGIITVAFSKFKKNTACTATFIMIMFHTLSTSAIAEPPNMMIQLIQQLLSDWETIQEFDNAADEYLDIFYQGLTPSESIHTIHYIWKSCPEIELVLQMTYCRRLLKGKEYKILKDLVSTEMELFVSSLVVKFHINQFERMTVCTATFTVLFYVLHCSLSSNPRPDIRETIVSYIQSKCARYNKCFYEGFYHYLMLLDKDQWPGTEHLIHQLLHAERLNPDCTTGAIIIFSVKLMENNYHDKSKHFLQQNLEYLKDVTIAIPNLNCNTRRGYSLILLLILHDCCLSQDTNGTELAVTALHSLKVSLLDNLHEHRCYCYMGSENCGIHSDIYYSEHTDDIFNFVIHNRYNKNNNLFYLSNLYKDLFYPSNPDEDFFNNISEILEHVADDGKKANTLKKIVKLFKNDLCIEAVSNYVYIKLNQQTKIAQFVLDINKNKPEHNFLTKLTLKIGEYLNLDEKVIKDKKKVIYKCFCKVRSAVNNGDSKNINMDQYREVFTFMRKIEKEEEMEKVVKFSEFLIFVMLLLMGSTYGGHHKSAEMKKYLSLKYEYDKAILYLLWCSGDVEINPGPTLKKLKSIPASQKMRAWIWDMCSILLKLLKGFPVNSKPKDLWKDKPDNWPCDQPFYDPRNKSKGSNEDTKSDVNLLECILGLCNQQKLDISQYQKEITAWRADDKKLLFELHTCRREIQTINAAIQCIINIKDTAELHPMLDHIKIQIDFSVESVQNEKQKGTTDIIRGVAAIFCKISLGLHPMEKTDKIWRKEPTGWKKGRKFYDPNNAGKRTEKEQDKNLVSDLVEYIETENINIPSEYAALVTAWKQQHMQELCKIYIIHTNVAVIKNSLEYLKLERLLNKPDVLHKLKHHRLTLSTEWFDGCSASSEICEGNQASISQNKKRKLPHDENTEIKKTRQKISSNNVSQHIRQTSCTAGSSPDNTSSDGALQVINNMDFLFATAVNLSKDENSVPHNTTIPSTESDTQNTSQPSDHYRRQPIPGIDSLLQELDQNYGSVESQMEQPGDIVTQDNHTISVPTEGQSDGIVAQDSQTIALPSGGQSGDKANQNNKTDVPPEEQAVDTATQDNYTISVPIGEQHNVIDSQDIKTDSKSTDNQTDVESSENTENDELLNKIFACCPVESMKCDDLDSQLIKEMDQLVWWINDKYSDV